MNTISKTRQIDPFLRLQILKEYIFRFIDDGYKYSFNEFIHKEYPHEIPSTPEYFKVRATNCYYCDCKLVDGRKHHGHPKRATIDHYEPRSRGKTDRYVICCSECNEKKADMLPEHVAQILNRAAMRGRHAWGFSGPKLNFIAARFQQITNDIIWGTGGPIYFIIKKQRRD